MNKAIINYESDRLRGVWEPSVTYTVYITYVCQPCN